MWKMFEKPTGFIGSTDNYSAANLVILGAPMDLTGTFRPGTRMGPQHIRHISHELEEYSPQLGRDLSDYLYFDAGEIILPPGKIEASLNRIEKVLNQVLEAGKFPIILGGEHLISLPVIKAMTRAYPDLAVIHFDAHADLREEYLGERLSHATVMRRVAELIGGVNLFQLGIRSGTREEFTYARSHTNLFLEEVVPPLEQICSTLRGRPVYITIDIDIVDPAYAPGTGTPEPGGCTPREIIQAIYVLSQLQVAGLDLVEVNPVYDFSGRTSLLAARLVREAILSFVPPKDRLR